jgi:4-alpha-glucanotransferase
MVKNEFPGLFVIAEALGDLSEAAKSLVTDSGFPGMKVLQFAFSGDPGNPYLPHAIPKNSVCYTGTHDNNTLVGWLRSAPPEERKFAMEYLGLSRFEDLPGAILAQALASNADTAIIPMQDWLGLGAEARLNKPSTVGGRNWKWRVPKGALAPRLASRIRHATKELYSR